MPAEFQGSAKSIAFSPLQAPDQTQAEQQQLNQRVQWMKEDNQSQIESRRGVAAGMAERNRLQINLQDQDLRTLAGMSKTLTENLLEVQKDYRQNQFNTGFHQYWMGQGDPAEIKKYEENKATLAAVGSTTADAARKLAAEGAEPWAVSRLKQLSGDQKAGYLMAMTQDKGAGYGPWLDNLIATDDQTKIDLGNGRVLTPADARKGGPEAEAVATWARAEYLRQNGLQGANLAMLNDKLIPFMKEGEVKVMAKVIEQANRERGGIESQETISVMISGLKTEPGLSFTEANRKLASVINPETGQVYGLNGARKLLQKLVFDLASSGKDEGINRDTVKAIMDHPDLDGKQTWGERFKGEWLGIDAALDKAEQADLAQSKAQEDQDADEIANNFIKLGEQRGGFTEAEVSEYKGMWAKRFGARPLPSAVANYLTKERVQADLTEKIIKRRLGRGEIIDPEDTRGLDPEVLWKFRDEIKQHNEQIVKNPEVQSAFTTLESALKNQLTASSSLTSPHYTLEPAKQEAKRMYIEAYKTFLEGSSDKNPATARQKAYETVLDRIIKGKDDPTSKFYLNKDKPNDGYLNFIPEGSSAASYTQATKQAAAWRNLVAKKGDSEIFRTLLIPPEDVPYLAQIAKDPSLPAPPSIHVLTEALRSTGWKGSFWDVMDAQFGVAFPNQTFRKPASVALIDSASSKEIRALFTNYSSARRTQRGFATMPWSKEKVPNGYGSLIEQAAAKEGLDPALLAGVLHWETRGKPFDRYAFNKSSGAKGLAQIDPITQIELKVKDPYNPQEAIPAAARYLKRLIDRFGSVEIGIRAYNQGPGATEKSPGGNSRESIEYPAGALRMAATYGYGGAGMNRQALVHPSLIPYLNQRSSPTGTGDRECFSTTSAMLASAYTGRQVDLSSYNAIRSKYGDSTSPAAQVRALKQYGINSSVSDNGSLSEVASLVSAGKPVAIGLQHNAAKGHWIVVTGVTPNGDFICNDPFGRLRQKRNAGWEATNSQQPGDTTGQGVVYKRSFLSSIFEDRGPGTGRIMRINGKK
jgi:soluble lytic murein transglycosylase-like protein